MTTALVTGANRGIGLAFARALASAGHDVIGTARAPERAAELAEVARVLPLNVTEEASHQALATSLQGQPIDLLVANAGILRPGGLEDGAVEDIVAQFITNAVGPLLTVRHLLPNLRAAAAPKVVCITSRMGSIADNDSGGAYGYRASKAALNAMVKSLSLDVDFPVIALHPGWIQTGMTNGSGQMGPDEAVARMLRTIETAQTGHFYHRDGQELPW